MTANRRVSTTAHRRPVRVTHVPGESGRRHGILPARVGHLSRAWYGRAACSSPRGPNQRRASKRGLECRRLSTRWRSTGRSVCGRSLGSRGAGGHGSCSPLTRRRGRETLRRASVSMTPRSTGEGERWNVLLTSWSLEVGSREARWLLPWLLSMGGGAAAMTYPWKRRTSPQSRTSSCGRVLRAAVSVSGRTRSLRGQRARERNSDVDPCAQLTVASNSGAVDLQPTPHRPAADLHRPSVNGPEQPRRVRWVDPHHQAPLLNRGDGHVAVDEERKSAEHALLGHCIVLPDQTSNARSELDVVGHLPSVRRHRNPEPAARRRPGDTGPATWGHARVVRTA